MSRNPSADRHHFHQIQEAGQALFDSLLDKTARELLVPAEEEYLVLRLDEHLSFRPWEILHDGQFYMSERFALSREGNRLRDSTGQGPKGVYPSEVRVALLGAGRDDLSHVPEELRSIRRALAASSIRSRAMFEATESDFVHALAAADVLHFSGHAIVDFEVPQNSRLLLEGGESLSSQFRAGEEVWGTC